MTHYEYKVVPAPRRGERVKGVRAAEDRFAIALTGIMNTHAAEGWEYQRTETLPSEEREGLMGKATVFQNMMVFRRLRVPETQPLPTQPALIEDKRGADDAPSDTPPAPTRPAGLHPVFQTPPLTARASDDVPSETPAPPVITGAPADVPGPVVTDDDRR